MEDHPEVSDKALHMSDLACPLGVVVDGAGDSLHLAISKRGEDEGKLLEYS